MNKELSQRIITGAILGALLLVLILYAMTSQTGVHILLAVSLLCCFRAAWEVYSLRGTIDLALASALPAIGVLFEILRIGDTATLQQLAGGAITFWIVVTGAFLFIRYTSARDSIDVVSLNLAPALVLLFSVSLPLALITALIGAPHGVHYLLWTLIVVSATDIAAYFGGRAVGGPKLAPVVSPGKTWSGLASGVAAACLVGTLWGYFFMTPTGVLNYFFLAVLVGFMAQASDLAKSHVKRQAGVKDTGQLLPGHGGLLDRIDGHLGASALITCYLLTFS